MQSPTFLVILGVGLTFIFLGVMLRLGKLRWAYAGQSMPVYAQRENVNISIPLGLGFLIIALMGAFPDSKDQLTYPLFFSFLACVVFAIWQPWWLKPAWFRWLEDNYGHVLEEMFAEARAVGRFNWAQQVKTQEELERWADGIAQRRGWQRMRKSGERT